VIALILSLAWKEDLGSSLETSAKKLGRRVWQEPVGQWFYLRFE